MPRFTIVIPTHNRYDKLRNLLKSIDFTKPVGLEEIIVVDDSSRKVEIENEFPCLNIHRIVSSERLFISRAKNLGWRKATSDIIFFIDDDNIVNHRTFVPIIDKLAKSKCIGALVPAVLYKNRPDLVWVYATPLAKDRWSHVLIGRNKPRNPKIENRFLDTDALANSSVVKRSVLELTNGFEEKLSVNSSADLCLRIKKMGFKVYAYTGSFIYHDVTPPSGFGWWAEHGTQDPLRVNNELKDWILLMRFLHFKDNLFVFHAMLRSMRFVLPNMLVYIFKGKRPHYLVKNVITGYLDGFSRALKFNYNRYNLSDAWLVTE
ncbi:hypothetical protein B9Q06_03555 [Candidatus Marsarchaeota G2 archaeon ECH_B_2]|uniref:Glycosyltransferase 2-like domain-containing protein n=3 Tax=Candidatus Marsarchaeota group 2 TaxID=2203771 RepID=A0A2R6BC28_9ARCH|nr:MAG: hypothetical protein B9Q06_08650 [Candidatus Marsarchaeota G2 archaeon ECH_B_2]PSN96166.1 MAG: hypothetical protein B9Q06_03555 [Candidatus Marsarchaeota G2 archaeon ECH_B_2]PSN98328.1 MAG: hypothetical protein B9Q07_09950 [Candidatus Marsarchaeota G2 archaeon ECH_B_3]PSO02633.1 MAG: hypothetical protein B9Q05_03780 [Candidatus Marsarchaeota G2 archaeon ECH_B_1]